MIEEPYRWVEAVANRREYIEDQLRRGSPIVLLPYVDGLLLLTVSRDSRKIFEVYDRIACAALGHPADIERMRLAAIDLAHLEGFNRAVTDVSLRRLVNYGLSPPLKNAFEQVFSAPFIVKIVLAELGDTPDNDVIYKLDYDGSLARNEFDSKQKFQVVAGVADAEEQMLQYLAANDGSSRCPLDDAIQLAAQTWAVGAEISQRRSQPPSEEKDAEEIDTVKVFKEQIKNRQVEAAVLDRNRPANAKFRLLDDKETRAALKDL